MNIKKIIAGILSCCVIGGVLPYVPVISENTAITANAVLNYGNLTYEIKDSSYISIKSFDNTTFTVNIPSEIEDLPVTEIAGDAFKNASLLESVTIPEGVTSIGNSAFYNCSSLKSISLPSTLTTIGSSAFKMCISLEEIDIPKKVTSIGSSAFEKCVYLQSLEFPSGLSSISDNIASGCTSLSKVVINHGPTSIGENSFTACTSLKTVEIPLSVVSMYSIIGHSSFNNTVEDVYYAGSIVQWETVSNRSQLSNATIHYGAKAPVISNYKKGDMNGDGLIDASDASEILAYYAYLSTGGTLDYDEYKEQV